MFGKRALKGLGITLKHGVENPGPFSIRNSGRFCTSVFGAAWSSIIGIALFAVCASKPAPIVCSALKPRLSRDPRKRLLSYTIDLQYCLFCNLCVEACPTHTFFFVHNFELSTDGREQIKRVYTPPAGVQVPVAAAGAELIPPEALEPEVDAAAEAKRRKQIEAIKTALSKGGQKVLAKYVDTEEDAAILAELLQAD